MYMSWICYAKIHRLSLYRIVYIDLKPMKNKWVNESWVIKIYLSQQTQENAVHLWIATKNCQGGQGLDGLT